jgi:hypothetical protein
VTWLLHEGFEVHREHPRTPLLRLDVKRTVRWAESLEHALEEVLGALPRRLPHPVPEGGRVPGGPSPSRRGPTRTADVRARRRYARRVSRRRDTPAPVRPPLVLVRPVGRRRRPGSPTPVARDGSARAQLPRPPRPPPRPLAGHHLDVLAADARDDRAGARAASRDAGYSYAVAGLVTGAHQIGVGLGSPIQGKLVDRFGQRVVLHPGRGGLRARGGLSWPTCSATAPVWLLVVAAVASGLVYPPTTACAGWCSRGCSRPGAAGDRVRGVVDRGRDRLHRRPARGDGRRRGAGGRYAVVLAGVLALVGALGFAATEASRTTARRDVAATGRGGALRSPGVRVMVVALGFVAVVFGAIDVVLPAVAEFAGRGSRGRRVADRRDRRRQPRRRGRLRRPGVAGDAP